MTVVAWWLTLFGVWPLAHPEHHTLSDLLTLTDLALHVIGVAVLASHAWRHRDRLMGQTIGCTFGAHRSCTGWGDATRRHGFGAQIPCACRCHAKVWMHR